MSLKWHHSHADPCSLKQILKEKASRSKESCEWKGGREIRKAEGGGRRSWQQRGKRRESWLKEGGEVAHFVDNILKHLGI
jgi:hypothetical protein